MQAALMLTNALMAIVVALLLDYLFKEPRRFHPLVGFGNLANRIEKVLNHSSYGRLKGCFSWAFAVLPFVLVTALLSWFIQPGSWAYTLLSAGVLYLAVGWQSLLSHAQAIAQPLRAGDISAARQAVGRIVSRDTSELDEQAIASAATESVLENGADAIFGAIFWFLMLGVPGVVLYRLSNTLDAMWGYKNERFLHFGWAAARIDDVLNYIPARLTALSYALVGNKALALAAWRMQAATWKSPNAGPVMAAGAGAINTRLGGAALYHGEWQSRPDLGPNDGGVPSAASIAASCSLVNRALFLWLLCVGFFVAVHGIVEASL